MKINWIFSIAVHIGVLILLVSFFSKVTFISSTKTYRKEQDYTVSLVPQYSVPQTTSKHQKKQKTIAPKKPEIALPHIKVISKEPWSSPQQDTQQEHIAASSFMNSSKLLAIKFNFNKKTSKTNLPKKNLHKTSKRKTNNPSQKNNISKTPKPFSKQSKPSSKRPKAVAPVPIYHPKPHYPRRARQRKLRGKVLLKVEILTSGKAGKIIVIGPSRYSILNKAAVTTVQKWRFRPALQGGRKIISWLKIPLVFRLR